MGKINKKILLGILLSLVILLTIFIVEETRIASIKNELHSIQNNLQQVREYNSEKESQTNEIISEINKTSWLDEYKDKDKDLGFEIVPDENKDWQTITDKHLEIEFKTPSNASIKKVFDKDSLYFLITDDDTELILKVNKPYDETGLDTRSRYYYDIERTGTTTINGKFAVIFEERDSNGYCDGPGCSRPYINYAMLYNNKYYDLHFWKFSETGEKILNSFRFTGDDTTKKVINWCYTDGENIGNNELWISSEYFNGMNHAPTIRHVCRGGEELFHLQMEWDDNTSIHTGKLISKTSGDMMTVTSTYKDPEFKLYTEQNKIRYHQVWLIIDNKLFMYEEFTGEFMDNPEDLYK